MCLAEGSAPHYAGGADPQLRLALPYAPLITLVEAGISSLNKCLRINSGAFSFLLESMLGYDKCEDGF